MSGASTRKASSADSKKPPLSCAECRRLKLKCNREWPCSSCQKRGLAELCPEGSLSTRPRHKPPPPTPQHVLQRIYELQARINELESALALLQATVSPEPHPLLKTDSQPYLQKKLMRKAALEQAQARKSNVYPSVEANEETIREEGEETDEEEQVIEALGTLRIAPDGRSRFFGPSAVSEGLSIEQEPELATNRRATSLPVDIVALAESFPFATLTEAVNSLHEHIKSYLPRIDRAEALCATYFTRASFVQNTLPQDEWFENLFIRLYGTRRSSGNSSEPDDESGSSRQWQPVPADELSVFFNVLAIGALADPSMKPFSVEAETYYQLSTALLTRETVLTEPTVASVQTIFLGSYYEGMQSQSNSSRDCWVLMALAQKTGQIMGLHRDHSMFGLEAKEIQKRRVVFWETYSFDVIQSLALGRPLATPVNQMDTQLPVDTFATTSPTGEIEESFHQWKYRWCETVMSVVSDHVLRVKPPSYAIALEGDRKLRQFTTTYGRGVPNAEQWSNPKFAAQLQFMIGTRETSILYIHRGFFAHAVSTEPVYPERSKYGRSVLSAYESACIIVGNMRNFVRSHIEFAARVWFFWNHLLSASFVLGSIVARAPGSTLASPASAQLDIVHEILRRTAVHGGRAEYMLPLIEKLRAKGHSALMEYQAGPPIKPPGVQPSAPVEENDELAVIGGKARVVLSRPSSLSPPQPPPPQPEPAADTTSIAPTALDVSHQPDPSQSISDVYQALEEYVQPPDVHMSYPPYVSELNQDKYWPQENYAHPPPGTSELVEHSQPPSFAYSDVRGEGHQDAAYLLSQHDYPGYTEDSLMPDVSPSLWQSLVRDLGV